MGEPSETTSLTGKGPKDLERRRCVDVICLAFFVAAVAALGGLSGVIFIQGDARKIFNGVDYLGNTCGASKNVTSKPKIWYPRIADDLAEQPAALMTGFWWDIYLYGICVETCPTYNRDKITKIRDYGYAHSSDAKKNEWSVYMGTIELFNRCVPATKDDGVSVDLCTIPTCTDAGAPCFQTNSKSIVQAPSGAWRIGDKSAKLRCEREVKFTYATEVMQPGANAYLSWFFKRVTQIKDTWENAVKHLPMILVFGILLALVVNFAWLVLLYFTASLIVWLCIAIILVGTLAGAGFCAIKSGAAANLVGSLRPPGNTTEAELGLQAIGGLVAASDGLLASDPQQTGVWIAGSAVLAILFLIFAITVCCGFKAINRCIVLVEQGSLVIGRAPALSLLPLGVSALQLLVVACMALTLATLTTVGNSGTYVAKTSPGHVSPTYEIFGIGAYVVFACCWVVAFLTAVELMTVAAVVFYFYFVSKESVPPQAQMKQYDDNQTGTPTLTHLGWVLRYHMGTLAFGSLIIAVVTFIQLVLKGVFTYLEKHSPIGDNFMIKMVSGCVQCCLWCFKKTIEFINGYAYVYCFVENIGFCHGCVKTFGLITRYPAQIAINTSVQFVLATLLSITTPVACGVLAFIYFDFLAKDASSHTGTGGLLLPGVVVVIAFFVSRAFAAVWEQVIQSLTVCVLHDVDNFDGRFLRPSMTETFGNPTKAELEPAGEGKAEGDVDSKEEPLVRDSA